MANDNEDSDEQCVDVGRSSKSLDDVQETSIAFVPEAELVSSLIITQALENFDKGQRKEYDALVQKLGDPCLKAVHLQRFLKALKRCVSLLTKKCDILVGTVLKVNWANSDEETAEEFIDFLMTLVSAQTFYLKVCLRMLTKLFLPNVPKGMEPQDVDIAEQDRVFIRAHSGLQAILELVPTTPKFLLPVLSDYFPYIKKHKIYQTSYIKNLLNITQYLPLLREEILECVVNHITKIDVEVPRHELEEPEEEEITQFEVDLESKKVENESQLENQTTTTVANEMGECLDALMEILYVYIRDLCHVDGIYLVDSGTELFNQLMTVYEKIILPTHASCHVHFVVFYICSLDQTFANSFLDLCWKKIENPNVPSILRQASAAYMASFVARAKFIAISTVKLCLELLVHWIHSYIDIHDANSYGPDAARHGPFYSICQALLYMFVFRHRSLLELEEGHKFVRRLNFERIITCRLNPLKICLPTIVNLFALVTRFYMSGNDGHAGEQTLYDYEKLCAMLYRVLASGQTVYLTNQNVDTRRHQIVLCYTVIERNKRSLLPIASVQSNKAVSRLSVFNQLDAFFPFDPYLLRKSGKFIKPLYQEWESVQEDTADVHDELDEKAKDLESEDEEEYMEYGKTPDIDVPGLTPDISMCISPGFAVSPVEYEPSLHHGSNRVTKHTSKPKAEIHRVTKHRL